MASVVFYNFYSSTLVSYLTSSKVREYPQTVTNVINDGKLNMLIIKNGLEQEMMAVRLNEHLRSVSHVKVFCLSERKQKLVEEVERFIPPAHGVRSEQSGRSLQIRCFWMLRLYRCNLVMQMRREMRKCCF